MNTTRAAAFSGRWRISTDGGHPMFCCKKRKARKAAKAQAIVSSLAAVESALEGKTAEMFAEKRKDRSRR